MRGWGFTSVCTFAYLVCALAQTVEELYVCSERIGAPISEGRRELLKRVATDNAFYLVDSPALRHTSLFCGTINLWPDFGTHVINLRNYAVLLASTHCYSNEDLLRNGVVLAAEKVAFPGEETYECVHRIDTSKVLNSLLPAALILRRSDTVLSLILAVTRSLIPPDADLECIFFCPGSVITRFLLRATEGPTLISTGALVTAPVLTSRAPLLSTSPPTVPTLNLSHLRSSTTRPRRTRRTSTAAPDIYIREPGDPEPTTTTRAPTTQTTTTTTRKRFLIARTCSESLDPRAEGSLGIILSQLNYPADETAAIWALLCHNYTASFTVQEIIAIHDALLQGAVVYGIDPPPTTTSTQTVAADWDWENDAGCVLNDAHLFTQSAFYLGLSRNDQRLMDIRLCGYRNTWYSTAELRAFAVEAGVELESETDDD